MGDKQRIHGNTEDADDDEEEEEEEKKEGKEGGVTSCD
jgi:hypothetical protein